MDFVHNGDVNLQPFSIGKMCIFGKKSAFFEKKNVHFYYGLGY